MSVEHYQERSSEQFPGPELGRSGLDLAAYLGVLSKFKWGIINLTLLCGLIGLYVALNAQPIYRSTAKLQIERNSTTTALGQLLGQNYYSREFYSTQYEMIKSWGVAEMAATRLGLLDAYQPGQESNGPSAGNPGFSPRRFIAEIFDVQPPVLTTEQRREIVVAGIQNSTQVSPVPRSELVSISFESADAAFAARQANTVAESYIEFLKTKYLEDITGSQSWYASRLEQGRHDLEAAENSLQAFRERYSMLETSGGLGSTQSQRLQLAITGRDAALREKLRLEDIYAQINSVRNDTSATLETVLGLQTRDGVAPLLQTYQQATRNESELAGHYGPKHPRLIEAREELVLSREAYHGGLERAADNVVTEYQQIQREEATQTNKFNQAEAEILELSRRQAELSKLENDVNSSRNLYEQLQTGIKSTGMLGSGIQQINAMIIEYARAGLYPVRPNKKKMVLNWALIGLALGLGVAFLLNRLDNTLKNSTDVERHLGLPIMGLIPRLKIPKHEDRTPWTYFESKEQSAFTESIRTVRTGVMISSLEQSHTSILVTSSLPGEGKTTIAVNLAHSVAKMKKTLLIDLDLRRASVRKIEQIDREQPGITNWISGEAQLEDIVQSSSDNLDVLVAGVIPSNPLDILASPRLEQLLNKLKQKYEYIIIDSAPVLAVSDSILVSQLTDMVLFVVQSEATPYHAAEQGIKRLRRTNAPLPVVLLNKISPQGYRYGYGKYAKYYGYGYDYDQGPDYYGENART